MNHNLTGTHTVNLQNPCKRALEMLYDRYNKILYGMIFFSIPDVEAAQFILQQVFASLDKKDIESLQDRRSARLMQLTRKCIAAYIQNNNTNVSAPHCVYDLKKIDDNALLQLAVCGRYSLAELSMLLGIDELSLRLKLRSIVRLFVNSPGNEALNALPVDFIPQYV